MLLNNLIVPSRTVALIGFTLAIAAAAQPAAARDHSHKCLTNPGQEQTATFVFHPRLFGVDGNEGDGDVFTDDFEHRFHYTIVVTSYDASKPGWTGPTACKFDGSFGKDWDMPNLRYEFMETSLEDIVYVENVPRYSRVHVTFDGIEDDDGEDDWADFDPSPGGSGVLDFDVFVDAKVGRTMVGQREGRDDLALASVKRVVGDGRIAYGHDHFRAFLEFVANIHPNNWINVGIVLAPPPLVTQPVPGKVLQPASTDPNANPACRDYALMAVNQYNEAKSLNCSGLNPPVWSSKHQDHFDWCAHGNNVQFAAQGTQQRQAALASCKQANAQPAPPPAAPGLDLCGAYANEAVKAAVRADVLGCGFSGPRWLQDFKAHYDFCSGNPVPALVLVEQVARDTQLQDCMIAKGN